MNSAPLTIIDHGNAIMLSESIELMALSLPEEFLDEATMVDDKTTEHALYAGLNLIAHAAHTWAITWSSARMSLNGQPRSPARGQVMRNNGHAALDHVGAITLAQSTKDMPSAQESF